LDLYGRFWHNLHMATRCERAITYLKAALSTESVAGERVAQVSEADSPVVRPFAAGLCSCYVVDDGSSFSFIQNRDLLRDKCSVDALHACATENLRQIARTRLQVVPQPGEFFAALLGGNFEASLMLLDGLWDKGLRHVIQHDFVVAIPARDVLAFCDNESVQGLQSLTGVIKRIWPGGDQLISQCLYRRRPSGWEQIWGSHT